MLPDLFMKIFEPLLHISDSLPSIILILFLVHLLWFAGLHGTNILGAIISSISLSNLAFNQSALQAGEEITKIWAGSFFDLYALIGGVGTTLGLAIAMVRSDPDHKYFFIIDEINRGNLSKILVALDLRKKTSTEVFHHKKTS